jgi:hypothetical protein
LRDAARKVEFFLNTLPDQLVGGARAKHGWADVVSKNARDTLQTAQAKTLNGFRNSTALPSAIPQICAAASKTPR